MAEQRTNVDIEDVLSSIRRLVSEEPPRPRRPEVLVLTPALRVVEGSAPPRAPRSVKTEAADYETWPSGLPLQDGVQTSPVRLTDFALPLGEFAISPKPVAAPSPSPEPLRRSAPSAQSLAQGTDAPAAPEPDLGMPAEEEIAAFFQRHSADGRSLEDRIAGLQAAIAQTGLAAAGTGGFGAEFEPDGSEAAESLSADVVRRSEDERRSLGADPVAPEARFTAARPQSRIEDAIELPQDGFTADPLAVQAQPKPVPETDYEEALIDEDSLRDIVAELVRQELRGELGERITRNVRSLIRRELNRALTLRDLRDD